jgi:TolB-like protein/DNA-binding winged helix-turn-helix (wHTH) protein
MTAQDLDSSVQLRSRQLRFDRYVLDLDRGCLLFQGDEIALRPKTFAVLQYLIEHTGRLVSKDELFEAVWPRIAVSDDALVQSIGELRRAFADDGSRLIKTVPRRGYRFDSTVSVAAVVGATLADGPPAIADQGLPTPKPVARNVTRILISLAVVIPIVAGTLGSIFWFTSHTRFKSPEFGSKPAIAILPLLDESDDSTREYFADGLTQDIISALGRFTELTVMSWNAVSPFKGKPASPGEIARSLAVRYQLEGSVWRAGDRVRVTAQLVNTDGQVLWSARFDEALSDLFALQDRITTQIAGALAIRISQAEQQRAFLKPTENLEAYDYVLRARPASLCPDLGLSCNWAGG